MLILVAGPLRVPAGLFTWRKEDPRRRDNFSLVTYRNFGPCGAQVKKELKTAGDKNKNAIWALLLLLALTTTFLQNYHNNQVLVTPNEMVGLLPSVTTKLPAAIFFSGLSLVLGSS